MSLAKRSGTVGRIVELSYAQTHREETGRGSPDFSPHTVK